MEDDAGGRFIIDANTGVIRVADPDAIDYSEATEHELAVEVTDSAGHTLTQTFTVDVAVANRAPASMSLGRSESDEFVVNQHGVGDQTQPVITALDNGGFLSVWTNQNSSTGAGGDGSGWSIKARCLIRMANLWGASFKSMPVLTMLKHSHQSLR